jgi:XapX domain-containing protein
MYAYLVSLLTGLAVGTLYSLLHVRSPAPPLVKLIGLLGMVLGEQATDAVKRHFLPLPAPGTTAQPPDTQAPGWRRLPATTRRY